MTEPGPQGATLRKILCNLFATPGSGQMNVRNHMMIRIGLGILLGALAGYALHKWVGCSTGACPLTANPFVSTLYGAILGALFTSNLNS